MGEHRRLRFEGERNEAGKAAGFVLQLAQLAQMIDALLERLDVAVEHRAGAAAAHLMPGAMHLEPFLGGFFAAADLVAHTGIENLRAAAGDASRDQPRARTRAFRESAFGKCVAPDDEFRWR